MVNSKYKVNQIVYHRGHKCIVLDVWYDEEVNKYGVTIKPIGDYGFPIDIYNFQV